MATAQPEHEQPAPEPVDRVREGRRQLDRVNAFSDGVFSIAATLLVLGVEVPKGPASKLPQELRNLEGPLISYFISFAVVGIFWFHHHKLFGRMRASDTGFATLNLAFLSFIALIPAPTQLLATYDNETSTVVIYALNVIALVVLSWSLSFYADRKQLSEHPPDPEFWLGRWATVIAFGISIPVAFVDPDTAVKCWLLAAILPRVSAVIQRRVSSG